MLAVNPGCRILDCENKNHPKRWDGQANSPEEPQALEKYFIAECMIDCLQHRSNNQHRKSKCSDLLEEKWWAVLRSIGYKLFNISTK